tara:strand:- start:362 stop:919 length:558 start_codon:yes stop_codon:yes gene_type:complete
MTPNYHEECVICTESDYNENDDSKSLIVTICGHHFHYACLNQWCNINNSCPSCRTKNVLSPNQLSVMTPISPSNNNDNNDNDNNDNDNNDNNSFIFDGLISSGSTATTASNVSPYILNRINYDSSNNIINNNEERNNSNIIINNLGNYQERNNPDYFNNIYNYYNNNAIIIENNNNNYRSRGIQT